MYFSMIKVTIYLNIYKFRFRSEIIDYRVEDQVSQIEYVFWYKQTDRYDRMGPAYSWS